MEISTTDNQTATTAAAAQSTASQNFREEYNTFLMLLTTQIRNQDPLAPLDATQFVEQLATFSSLEQQVTTNDHLEAIGWMIAQLFEESANEWVGTQGEVTTSWVPYEGGEVEFTADIPAGADNAVMVLRDTAGNLIDSQTLKADQAPWTWDGKTAKGAEADSGLYQMTIELYKDGQAVGVMEPRIIAKVTSVSVEDGEVVLGFENRITQSASQVIKHQPQ